MEDVRELGAASKNLSAYRERYGNKDNGVNWGHPPLHKEACKEDTYKPERWSGQSFTLHTGFLTACFGYKNKLISQ